MSKISFIFVGLSLIASPSSLGQVGTYIKVTCQLVRVKLEKKESKDSLNPVAIVRDCRGAAHPSVPFIKQISLAQKGDRNLIIIDYLGDKIGKDIQVSGKLDDSKSEKFEINDVWELDTQSP